MAVRLVTIFASVLAITVGSIAGNAAWAHCDAESGPVAVDAQSALESGDFERIAIWVAREQTEELRSVFDRSLPVAPSPLRRMAYFLYIKLSVNVKDVREGKPPRRTSPLFFFADLNYDEGNDD